MKLLIVLCCITTLHASAQTDLLLLKKKGHSIQTWIPGSFITFQFSNGQWVSGRIKTIRHDSLFVNLTVLREVGNAFGFARTDTGYLGMIPLSIHDIYGLPKRSAGSGIISGGQLFKIGGGAYIFLNIFNSLIHHEPVFSSQNAPGLGIAAGVFLLGVLLQVTHHDHIILGRQYALEIITGNNEK